MLHYALGDALIRTLTLASRRFFDEPPDGFSEVPLGRRMPVLIHAREEERAALDSLEADISSFAPLERLDAQGVRELCPLLKADAVYGLVDRDGLRLDPHALLQGFARQLRRCGGELARQRFGRGARVRTVVGVRLRRAENMRQHDQRRRHYRVNW